MRAALLLPVAILLGGCELILREPHLFRHQFEGAAELCGLAGARFSEGSFLFGTPSIIDLHGLSDQDRKKACIIGRSEFEGQNFEVRTGP